MGLFGPSRREIQLERENSRLRREHSKREKQLEYDNQKLQKENTRLAAENAIHTTRISELEDLSYERDRRMDAVMSDGLRHGSPEAGREMRSKRDSLRYKNKK